METTKKKVISSRFFVCSKGSITDLEEIYTITQPLPGYGEHEGQWRFKAVARLDGKPLEYIYDDHKECLNDQTRMAMQLVDYHDGWLEIEEKQS